MHGSKVRGQTSLSPGSQVCKNRFALLFSRNSLQDDGRASRTAHQIRVCKTPLLEALQQHVQRQATPMHIPGHKQGSGLLDAFASVLRNNPLSIDLTELPGEALTCDFILRLSECEQFLQKVLVHRRTHQRHTAIC